MKLSALHPRFEPVSRSRVLVELGPRLVALARKAKACDLEFTVDAEEADRLEKQCAAIWRDWESRLPQSLVVQ